MLAKPPLIQHVPAIPGRAGRAEETVCTPSPPPPPAGSYQYVCSFVPLPEGAGGLGIPVIDGQDITPVINDEGQLIGMNICRSEWVPDA